MPLIIDIEQIRQLGKRRSRPKRTPAVKPPAKAERALRLRTQQLWQRSIAPAVTRIKEAVKANMDPEDLAMLLEGELRRAEFDFASVGKDIIDMWRLMIDTSTRTAMHKALARSLGINIAAVLDEPAVADALALGSMEAANLIKSIPQQLIGDVAAAVMDNMRGTPLPNDRTLLQQIEHIGGVSKKRARLIARDQTSKMTSTLNQARQQSLGIDMYIWRTAKDQRVVGNPSGLYPKGNQVHGDHYVMEGLYCRWDDPTVVSYDKGSTWIKRGSNMPKEHPGQQIQCRCYAEPVVDIERILQYAQAA